MTPRLSIIIPAYNAEAYLPQCLDSIFSQDYSDFEVLVINDGSTDGTADLLGRYPKVKVINQKNQGMSTARNHGLDEAKGEYILFVDSDDRLADNALATLAPELTGEDIICFNANKFHESTGDYSYNPTIGVSEKTDGWSYFCRHRLESTDIHFVCIWQRAYKRAFLEEKHLRFADGLRRAEDDLFTTMAFLNAQQVKAISSCLYTYTVRQGSITRSSDPKLNADSWRVQQLLANTFIPMQGIDKQAIYQVLASNYINHLSHRSSTLTKSEWEQFRQVCVTPRHRRLYHIAHISPFLLRLYNRLCSSLR